MTNERASRSPELQEVLREAIEYYVRDIHVALPAKIESYDAAEQKANVKPLVQRLVIADNGEEFTEELPEIPAVPVVFPRGGSFFISMPVQVGDYCLLVFNSLPVDVYKSGNGADAAPSELDTHELTDAVALMGFAPFSAAIADADPDNIVIGEEQGVQMHVATDKIELGQKDAAEQASLDSKVQTELNRLQSDLSALQGTVNSLVTAYNTHIHVTTATVGATAAPGVIAPTTGQASPPAAIQSIQATNSELVTIKE